MSWLVPLTTIKTRPTIESMLLQKPKPSLRAIASTLGVSTRTVWLKARELDSENIEVRKIERQIRGQHLRKFGPPRSREYNREAKRLWRERQRAA